MLVVVGGGRFGCYHARQLLKAIHSGRLPGERLAVVDRDAGSAAAAEFAGAAEVELVTADWLAFLRSWLAGAEPDDQVIPAPLAPHLLWEWLAVELDADRLPPPAGWGLPYEVAGRSEERYLSAAGWACPATCVEPAHCPALHSPRDWDLAAMIEERAVALGLRTGWEASGWEPSGRRERAPAETGRCWWRRARGATPRWVPSSPATGYNRLQPIGA
jgi:hypothetical protein